MICLYVLFVLCQLAVAVEKPVPLLDERNVGGLGEAVDEELIRLWEHDTKTNRERGVNAGSSDAVRTIVTGGFWQSLRMDVGNPLFDARNDDIRADILNNAFLAERIDPNDARMETAEGLNVKNMQGNTMNFKKVDGVGITVNGVPLLSPPTEASGASPVVYNLARNLFEFNQKMETAYDNAPFERSEFGGPFNYDAQPPF